jgi:hypothetical protein
VLAFAPDGRRLAVAVMGGDVEICDSSSGEEIRQFRAMELPKGRFALLFHQQMHVAAMSFSPDGKWLVTGGQDTTVRVWEVATGSEALRLQGHEGAVTRVACTPNLRSIFSAGNDAQAYMWSARPEPAKDKSPKALWKDLADADAAKAYQAIWELGDNSKTTAAFLREQIAPAKNADPARLKKWIADLDNDEFPVRDLATTAIAAVGQAAVPALEKALKANTVLETRRRLQQLVSRLTREPLLEELRPLRAVQAMELAGTVEARATLRAWADGAAGVRLTEEARAALHRLEKSNMR